MLLQLLAKTHKSIFFPFSVVNGLGNIFMTLDKTTLYSNYSSLNGEA